MKTYRLSAPAEEDLFSIFLYTVEKWGEEQVYIYLGRIHDAFTLLADTPFAVGSKSRDDLATRCRLFKIGHHLIAYRPEQGYLAIARILHESMDFEQHIAESHFP
ncbi:MAG: hypothetical protein RLZZ505_1868 [Verrucomicrobiota bacterium]